MEDMLVHAELKEPPSSLDWAYYGEVAKQYADLQDTLVWEDICRKMQNLKRDWEREYLAKPESLGEYVNAIKLITYFPTLPVLARRRLEMIENKLQQDQGWKARTSADHYQGTKNGTERTTNRRLDSIRRSLSG